jgi:hypothetical protein
LYSQTQNKIPEKNNDYIYPCIIFMALIQISIILCQMWYSKKKLLRRMTSNYY